jgi:hypothetical protein
VKQLLFLLLLSSQFCITGTAEDFRHTLGGPLPPEVAGALSFATFTIDAATDQYECIIQAENTNAITAIGFRYGIRTGTPVQQKVSLQGVNLATSSGYPDGTILGGGSPASATFTPPADTTWDGTIQWISLANAYTPTRGQFLALVISDDPGEGGTPDASNSSSYSTSVTNASPVRNALPYSVNNNAGTRTRNTVYPLCGYKTASGTFGSLFASVTTTQYSSDSTPDEYALRFMLPSGLGNTFTISKVRALIRTPVSTKTVLVQLYSGTTALQSVTWDSDVTAVANSTERTLEVVFTDATLATLNFGTEYRLGFAPQETAANLVLYSIACTTASDLSAFPGGVNFYLSTRSDAGAWSDTLTSRPVVEFTISEWNEPTGGTTGASFVTVQ